MSDRRTRHKQQDCCNQLSDLLSCRTLCCQSLKCVDCQRSLSRHMCHRFRENRASLCVVARHKSGNTQHEGWQEHSGPAELRDVHLGTPSPIPASLTRLSHSKPHALSKGTAIPSFSFYLSEISTCSRSGKKLSERKSSHPSCQTIKAILKKEN